MWLFFWCTSNTLYIHFNSFQKKKGRIIISFKITLIAIVSYRLICFLIWVISLALCRRRMHGTFNQSQLDFEQWSRAQLDRAQVELEMQTQKKRMFKEVPPFKIPPRELPPSYLEPRNVAIQTIPEELEQLTLKNWVPTNESIPVGAS